MKRKIISLLLFFLFIGVLPLVKVFSNPFDTAYVRLNNQTPNSALSGTVCAQTSSTGTEAKVAITFPDTFTISTSPSDWTTDINNLPTGATAWPGIGAVASGVANKSITFASSDLSPDTLYCFNFAGASSTTGTTGTDQVGIITTKNSSNTTIDSTTYAVAIVENNQISVTASVPPQVSDLPITIESLDSGTQFPQYTTLSYQITYGLNTVAPFPLTIQAQWSQGTIEGDSTPSVDILDYVVGSASNAYGDTAPVIDTVNRTITWSISSFPANTTGQTVTFQLETTKGYTGASTVSFTVSARATADSTVTPDENVSQTYLYDASLEPTPTPTPSSTPTPTPTTTTTTSTTITPTPTVTPTPAPSAFAFSNIYVYSISQSQAQIDIATNRESTSIVYYGASATNLTQSLTSSLALTERIVTLTNLSPDTTYYFKVISTDTYGNKITSDIFIFKTAVPSEAPAVDTQSLIVTSNNNILTSPNLRPTASPSKPSNVLPKPTLVVPISTEFTIQFSLIKTTLIKSIVAFIVNKNVLAASTTRTEGTSSVALFETQPGVYTGKLLSLPDPGNYEIYVRLIDYNGNITVQKIADLKIVNKFTIFDKVSHKAIEKARVLLYLYNSQSRTYEIISQGILPITNPSYSLPDGTVDITLPPGKYRAEILALGYDSNTVNFSIDYTGDNYPTVYLNPQPFNLSTTIQYYFGTLSDAFLASQTFFRQQAQSSHLFDLTTIGALIFLIVITTLSISARTHIEILYLPYFLYFKFILLFKKDVRRIVFGRVIDEKTDEPITRANIYLSTLDGKQVLVNLISNKLGEFYYNNANGLDYRITASKEGYSLVKPWDFYNNVVHEIPATIKMQLLGKPHYSFFSMIRFYLEDFLGMLMEFLLIFGFFLEIYFISTFGFVKAAPFFAITVINILLVAFFLYKPRQLAQ